MEDLALPITCPSVTDPAMIPATAMISPKLNLLIRVSGSSLDKSPT